jgi:protein-L-isoaspartate(D-aspartate) O-methyltransferase
MAGNTPVSDEDFAAARELMIHDQLLRRGIHDERVLAAMGRVPRERFVTPEQAAEAYGDYPLPIGFGQTISQPFVVARIAELLELMGDERVLDIGAGSGYQAAVLAELCPHGQIYAIERIPELCALAEQRLRGLGDRVELRCQDGSRGWPAHAPYDAIAVAAGAPTVPAPLIAQLAEGGRLVIPIGEADAQRLVRVRKRGGEVVVSEDFPVRFVPLIGEHGFPKGEGSAPAG